MSQQSEVESFEDIEPETPPRPDADESLDELLWNYWRILKGYYWLILLGCLVASVGAYFWTKQQSKIYEASSKIVFHKDRGNVLGRNIEQVEFLKPGGRWEFSQFWHTQKQVFQARWFLERVVKKEGLLSNPDFLDDPKKGEERTRQEKMDAAVSKVSNVSRVHLESESRVGVVTAQMTHPELAAKIANGMAEAYVDYTKEFQSGGLKKITNWFDSYVSNKREELETAQSKLQKFKRKNNILSLSYEDRQNLTSQNMEAINEKLINVRSELSSERALLEQIGEMERNGQDLEAIADLVDDKALQKTFERESKLEQQLAELQTKYLDKHPKVQAVSEQLEVVRKDIRQRIERIKSGVANRVEVLERNKKSLKRELQRIRDKIFNLNELGVQYTQLKNRTENLKELYNTVLKRSSELDINSLYTNSNIEVLERAQVPESPVSPNMPLNLALGLALGLGLGAGGALLLDAFDTTIKSEEDVEALTNKSVLAMLPELDESVLRGLETIGDSPADTITHTAPKSSFAEGIKTLRTNLTFMAPDDPPEKLLVTSPGPGEGKTLTSLNMSIAMAQSGHDTLLIDSDLRRPRVHSALGLEREPGLSSVVKGQMDLESAVQSTMESNLTALTCGPIPPDPSELLHSEQCQELVQEMGERYDRVIFDSPPLAAVSDALILSHLVDGVLLMVEFGQTRRETLERSLEQLHGIGAPLLGLVLNEISTDGTGYGYSYYRYSYYGQEDEAEELPAKDPDERAA
jgi:capsular exopolysaccharide synthesis family protein